MHIRTIYGIPDEIIITYKLTKSIVRTDDGDTEFFELLYTSPFSVHKLS